MSETYPQKGPLPNTFCKTYSLQRRFIGKGITFFSLTQIKIYKSTKGSCGKARVHRTYSASFTCSALVSRIHAPEILVSFDDVACFKGPVAKCTLNSRDRCFYLNFNRSEGHLCFHILIFIIIIQPTGAFLHSYIKKSVEWCIARKKYNIYCGI